MKAQGEGLRSSPGKDKKGGSPAKATAVPPAAPAPAAGPTAGAVGDGPPASESSDDRESIEVIHVPASDGSIGDQSKAVPLDSDQSKAVPLDSDQSKPVPLDSEQSKAVPPDSEQSKAVPPESEQSKAVPPETDQSRAVPPESDQSRAVPPESDQSRAVPPDSDQPPLPKDDDAVSNASSSLPPFQFRKFTVDSYKRLLQKEEEWKRKAIEKSDGPGEGRLVDGELVYDEGGDDGDEPVKARDPYLVEGNMLPEHLEQDFPKELFSQPIEEIDNLLKDKTFVVITKRFKKTFIHRFTATKAFFLLAPWNPLRRLAVYIVTNQIFDYFIILTILVNCVFLALPETKGLTNVAEYVFLAIYSVEALLKLLARGFVLNTFTYLRDGWNWLDFLVIGSAYLTYILAATGGAGLGNITGLRTFRVLRVLKTVSIVPGLKTIIAALMKSMKMLAEVMFLTLFCIMVFALFALQVYAGILRQKCVKDIPTNTVLTHYEYSLYIKDSDNWFLDEDEYKLCGNGTGVGGCPVNYTCLPDIGDNPNSGYTNFDHFGWAMLSAFQLITLDFWEDLYNKVIRANGPANIIFFGFVVFFGSFYLINLMLAVVSMSYEEEAINAGRIEKEKERKREKQERKERRAREKKGKTGATSKEGSGQETKATTDAASASPLEQDDLSKTDTNHLHIAGNMNGSNSASYASLRSNGHLKNSTISIMDSALESMYLPRNIVKVEPSSKVEGLARHTETGIQGSIGNEANEADDVTTVRDCKTGSKELLVDGDQLKKTHSEPLGHVNTVSMMDDEELESIISEGNDGDAPTEQIEDDDDNALTDRNCQCCGRSCYAYPQWLAVQNYLYKIVTDIIFELFISFCITLNVLSMAIEHYPMDTSLQNVLHSLNYVFTGLFILEAFLKILAMSRMYFRAAWNLFDLLVVMISIVDIASGPDVEGLGVIRLLRLLRIFKLAQTWSTMKMLISIIVRTLGALGNLTVILFIVIYIFAVMGMQLFGSYYTAERFAPNEVPRWTFVDFEHSLVLIFRILCGEWIEPMWDCMSVAGELCMVVFLPTLVLGNMVVLNLFLALMLNSFATDSLQKGKEEASQNKMKQGWDKLKGIFKSKNNTIEPNDAEPKKPTIADILAEVMKKQKEMYDNEEKISNKSQQGEDKDDPNAVVQINPVSSTEDSSGQDNVEDSQREGERQNPINGILKPSKPNGMSEAFTTEREKFVEFPLSISPKPKTMEEGLAKDIDSAEKGDVKQTKSRSLWAPWKKKGEENKRVRYTTKQKADQFDDDDDENGDVKEVEDCFPPICYRSSCCERMQDTRCCRFWHRVREMSFKITEHKAFEYFILLIILCSSIALCFEDIYLYQRPVMKEVLYYLNILFAVVFTIEMLMKWVSLGFKTYFTKFWTVLDFCIVVVALVSLAAESLGLDQISAFVALRTLRAFRPLRAVSRWQGMKIVVNALVYAVPSIFNVLVVCMVFWLIFAIAGFQLFAGKFAACRMADGTMWDAAIVPNRTVCEAMQNNGSDARWKNFYVNFDNAIIGFLALLQVATFEGWMEIMDAAMDSRGVDLQPVRHATFSAIWFFYAFVFVGSFFSLNLFIGVIIDNFNRLKKKYEGGYLDIFLTSNQKSYYNTMKKLGNRKPQKTIKRPKNKVQGFFFDVAVSTKFELAIVVLILMNMVAMAFEHYHQSVSYGDALDIINIIFTTVFTLEALAKIIGLRWHYFRRAWNVFDLIVVVLSIIGVILDDLLRDVFITPTLLRVVRVFRIGRVLRLIKAAKGIRKLLFALVISMPALFNIGMLLLLVIFIFSIFGMTTFGEIRHRGALDDISNFETFYSSFVLLFRLTTAAGWNDILEPMMTTDGCNGTHRIMPDGTIKEVPNGDCTFPTFAALYMVFYIFFTYILMINMYIAVILENFSQAHEQEEVGITEDDFEMFYVVWERYDPHATQFIKVKYLSDLVADLDLPLGIPKPNEIALVAFDLPIMQGERLHCLDILTSLVKYVLGSVEDSEEFRTLKSQMEDKYKEAFPTRVTQIQISTTMRRKKEDVAAKTLQRAWRKHKAQQSIRKITEMAMEAKKGSDRRSSVSSFASNSPKSGRRLSFFSANLNASGSSMGSVVRASRPTTPQRKLGNTLRVPTMSDIVLPSSSDIKV